MRRVIYAMSVSVDGFIETASGDISWSFPDAELHQHFNDRESTIDTYLSRLSRFKRLPQWVWLGEVLLSRQRVKPDVSPPVERMPV